MAQECTESSVAISPSIPLNWWDLHHANSLSSLTNTSPWHQSNPSSNSSCEEDLSMSTSFTNASNHSGLTVESASSTELMGEHAYSHLWSQILLQVNFIAPKIKYYVHTHVSWKNRHIVSFVILIYISCSKYI